MKKIISVLFTSITLIFVFASCNKDSYADKLDKEDKAIKEFIREKGFNIVNQYPASRVFKNKEYFRDPSTGVYIHVIDSGRPDKIVKGDRVFMRFYDTSFIMSSPDSIFSNDKPNSDEYRSMEITFGNADTYTYSYDSYDYSYYYLSPGTVRPLDFNLGDRAEVSLLVPFVNGSYYQQYSAYEPIFYGRLKYIKY